MTYPIDDALLISNDSLPLTPAIQESSFLGRKILVLSFSLTSQLIAAVLFLPKKVLKTIVSIVNLVSSLMVSSENSQDNASSKTIPLSIKTEDLTKNSSLSLSLSQKQASIFVEPSSSPLHENDVVTIMPLPEDNEPSKNNETIKEEITLSSSSLSSPKGEKMPSPPSSPIVYLSSNTTMLASTSEVSPPPLPSKRAKRYKMITILGLIVCYAIYYFSSDKKEAPLGTNDEFCESNLQQEKPYQEGNNYNPLEPFNKSFNTLSHHYRPVNSWITDINSSFFNFQNDDIEVGPMNNNWEQPKGSSSWFNTWQLDPIIEKNNTLTHLKAQEKATFQTSLDNTSFVDNTSFKADKKTSKSSSLFPWEIEAKGSWRLDATVNDRKGFCQNIIKKQGKKLSKNPLEKRAPSITKIPQAIKDPEVQGGLEAYSSSSSIIGKVCQITFWVFTFVVASCMCSRSKKRARRSEGNFDSSYLERQNSAYAVSPSPSLEQTLQLNDTLLNQEELLQNSLNSLRDISSQGEDQRFVNLLSQVNLSQWNNEQKGILLKETFENMTNCELRGLILNKYEQECSVEILQELFQQKMVLSKDSFEEEISVQWPLFNISLLMYIIIYGKNLKISEINWALKYGALIREESEALFIGNENQVIVNSSPCSLREPLLQAIHLGNNLASQQCYLALGAPAEIENDERVSFLLQQQAQKKQFQNLLQTIVEMPSNLKSFLVSINLNSFSSEQLIQCLMMAFQVVSNPNLRKLLLQKCMLELSQDRLREIANNKLFVNGDRNSIPQSLLVFAFKYRASLEELKLLIGKWGADADVEDFSILEKMVNQTKYPAGVYGLQFIHFSWVLDGAEHPEFRDLEFAFFYASHDDLTYFLNLFPLKEWKTEEHQTILINAFTYLTPEKRARILKIYKEQLGNSCQSIMNHSNRYLDYKEKVVFDSFDFVAHALKHQALEEEIQWLIQEGAYLDIEKLRPWVSKSQVLRNAFIKIEEDKKARQKQMELVAAGWAKSLNNS